MMMIMIKSIVLLPSSAKSSKKGITTATTSSFLLQQRCATTTGGGGGANIPLNQSPPFQSHQQQQQLRSFSTTCPNHMSLFAKWFGKSKSSASAAEQQQPSPMMMTVMDYQKEIDQLCASSTATPDNIIKQLDTFSKKVDYSDDAASRALWTFYKNRILAVMYFKMDDYEAALKHCDRALEMETELERYHLHDRQFMWITSILGLKSMIFMNQMEYERAVQVLTTLIDERMRMKISQESNENRKQALNANLSLHLYRRASANLALNRLHEAVMDIDEAINLSGDQSHTSVLKAEVSLKRLEIEDAIQYAENAIALNTDSPSVYKAKALLAKCSIETGKYVEAKSLCDELLSQNSKDAEIYILRAECNSNLHNYEQVLEDCKHAESIDPSMTFSILELHANSLNRLARYDELVHYTSGLVHIVHDLDLPQEFEQCAVTIASMAKIDQMVWNGQYEQALDLINTVEPENKEVRDFVGTSLISRRVEVLLLCGKYKEALEAANNYVDHSDKTWADHVDSLELRAIAYANLDQFDQAYADLNEAQKQIEETNELNQNLREEIIAWHKYSRAQVMGLQTDRKDQSIQMYQEALNYSTEKCLHDMRMPILAGLADLEQKYGRVEEARKHRLEVLKYSPNHAVYSKL